MAVTTVTGGSGNVLGALNVTNNSIIKALVSTALANIVGTGSAVIDTSNGTDAVGGTLPYIFNPDVETPGSTIVGAVAPASVTVPAGTRAFILGGSAGETVNSSLSNVLIVGNNAPDTFNITGGSGTLAAVQGSHLNIGGNANFEVATGSGADTINVTGAHVTLDDVTGYSTAGGENLNISGGAASISLGTNTSTGASFLVSITGGNDTLNLVSGKHTVDITGSNATVSITNGTGALVVNDTSSDNDTITLGTGSATIKLGSGADTLNVSTMAGSVTANYTVNGFTSSDTVDIVGLAATAVASHVSYSGGNTIISLGTNSTLTLVGFHASAGQII